MDLRRALALALLAPLFLGGCDGDEPEPIMPDPTSSSPSRTPTPTESETPEAESAEDFVRRWQAVGDEMQVTGETAEYRKLSRNCTACKNFADQVDSIYGDGGRN